MIKINKIYKKYKNDKVYLCADVIKNDELATLWISINKEYSKYLVYKRSDCFVLALAFTATSLGENIVTDVPVSSRLLYQLNTYFLPSLAKILKRNPIKIEAPFEVKKMQCANLVGTGYSGGVDAMYTIMKHTNNDNMYVPNLDYICVINSGSYDNSKCSDFELDKKRALKCANYMNLKLLEIDSNFHEVLKEDYLAVYTYRLAAIILGVQKLFGTYLLSSGNPYDRFSLSRNNSANSDLLNMHSFNTETLHFISSGAGVKRHEKIKELSEFPFAYDNLHPCFKNSKSNCGHCKKCRRDTVTLWAYGILDKFKNVYDVDFALKNLDINIAFVYANRSMPLYKEVIDLLNEKNIEIPKRSMIIAKQFEKSLDNIKKMK